MDRCPFTKEVCGEESCILWTKLRDYAGCPLDIADQAIQEFKETTLLPAARTLDQMVRDYMKKTGGRRRK